jgi:hypothetical protein
MSAEKRAMCSVESLSYRVVLLIIISRDLEPSENFIMLFAITNSFRSRIYHKTENTVVPFYVNRPIIDLSDVTAEWKIFFIVSRIFYKQFVV